jgi:hypothetical protein
MRVGAFRNHKHSLWRNHKMCFVVCGFFVSKSQVVHFISIIQNKRTYHVIFTLIDQNKPMYCVVFISNNLNKAN